jgi:SAM-dependent methyltransferase
MYLLIVERGILNGVDKLLHFAPEPSLEAGTRKQVREYVTADLVPDGVDLQLDIEKMELADGSFDMVIANHVLEHVDDQAALAEIARILRAGGQLLVSVPIIMGMDSTYENPSINSDEERHFYYGQNNHLRLYGRDLVKRIEESGFAVEILTADIPTCRRFSINAGEPYFLCTATAADSTSG